MFSLKEFMATSAAIPNTIEEMKRNNLPHWVLASAIAVRNKKFQFVN